MGGTGCISLTFSLLLSFVFHVSNFKSNLVSVSHITKAWNCSITFLPSYFISEDLKPIGKRHEDQGL